MKRDTVVLFALSAVTLGLSLACSSAFPATADLTDGWRTPILAAELARTTADLAFMAGPDHEPIRAAMDAGHVYDSFFPFAYGSLLFVSAWTARAHGVARVALGCAPLAIGMDLRENSVLMDITGILRAGGDPEPLLGALFVATWATWCAIGTALGTIGLTIPHIVAEAPWLASPGRVIGGVPTCPRGGPDGSHRPRSGVLCPQPRR
jgi:hypothetical protein